MIQGRLAHWALIFSAFIMLLFSTQFLVYLGHQLKTLEDEATIHVFVKESDVAGFEKWRESLPVQQWQWTALSNWFKANEKSWKTWVRSDLTPQELFFDQVSGVWTAHLEPLTWTTFIGGRSSLELSDLRQNANVVNVIGYPRWRHDFYVWFWTWTAICLSLILVSAVMLFSSVMSDISLTMVDHKNEIEVKYFLGATLSQLFGPTFHRLMMRSGTIIFFAACLNVLVYVALAQFDVVELSETWVKLFAGISLLSILTGLLLVWWTARQTFTRRVAQWLSAV